MSGIKVSELNKYLKKYIAMDYLLTNVEVCGELSNVNYHSSGNIYLTLKDESAKINCIIYPSESRDLKFSLKNGDNVNAKGSVSIFERDGSIIFYIKEIELDGIGNLYEKYLYLKDTLMKEGLFNEEHKKKIPFYPRKVGVITSKTGAAIMDIINVLKRRNSSIDIILYPSLVQGADAPQNLINGLKYFKKNPCDVIIIGRGGGSFEELFAFNDENLAREIYNMEIPIISAVGHEVDYSISDFVADLRAPTPSAAAEMVSMKREDLNNSLNLNFNKLNLLIEKKIEESYKELNIYKNRLEYDFFNLVKDKKNKLIYLAKLLDYNYPKISHRKNDLKFSLNNLNINFSRVLKIEKFRLKRFELTLNNKKLDEIISSRKNLLQNLRYRFKQIQISRLNYHKSNLFRLKSSLKNPNFPQGIYIKKDGNLLLSAKNIDINDDIDIYLNDGILKGRIIDKEVRNV